MLFLILAYQSRAFDTSTPRHLQVHSAEGQGPSSLVCAYVCLEGFRPVACSYALVLLLPTEVLQDLEVKLVVVYKHHQKLMARKMM